MTAATFTREAQERLKRYLNRPEYRIPIGLGDREAACSVAAINLAIDGILTAEIPDCMSSVTGKWIIFAQDKMPSELRNSERWKAALVRAAGSGRNHERERADMLIDWLWETVLPSLQPIADADGFGEQWRRMCTERSTENASAAKSFSNSAASHVGIYIAHAAMYTAHTHAEVDTTGVSSMVNGAAANAVNATMVTEIPIDVWELFDPVGILERLVAVSEPDQGERR